MAREIFVDSSVLYALVDRREVARKEIVQAVAKLVAAGSALILTDFILDESLTLAKARSGQRGAIALLNLVEISEGFRTVWVGEGVFRAAIDFFRKHSDHGYSFTDCTSFIVMRKLRIEEVLTTDRHFAEAGFSPLLPVQ
jgi:predicted nucleic acid-binding protein